jgi:uncharacterized heparinase superfamily protein
VGQERTFPGRPNWSTHKAAAAAQLWQMNLHYMEYLEALPNDQLSDLIFDWVNENPPYREGAYWDAWNSYSISIRTVVWMQQFSARRGQLSSGFVEQAEQSLASQLIYLERHLETDLGGNHLIKNLKALLWGSVYFEGRAADRWRSLATRLLERETRRQILPDGFHFELSPAYHCQVFADLIEIRHAIGADPTGSLDRALVGAAQVVADMAHPDGKVAQFGDSGLSMAYAPRDCLEAYSTMFMETPTARSCFAFPSAGYYGLRAPGSYFVADAGRIGPDALPAHAHGDILSFEWSVAGKRLIVDQGVFEYVAGARREISRAASSHNTAVVGDCDQAEFFGSFRCGRRPDVHVSDHEGSREGLTLDACHDGFAHLHGRPVHRRKFFVRPDFIRIEDEVDGTGEVPMRASILLAPGTKIEGGEGGRWRLTRDGARATLASNAALAIEDAVWWPDMGVEQPTKRIQLTPPDGAKTMWTELTAQDAGSEGIEIEAD